jgi:hypothetical protein
MSLMRNTLNFFQSNLSNQTLTTGIFIIPFLIAVFIPVLFIAAIASCLSSCFSSNNNYYPQNNNSSWLWNLFSTPSTPYVSTGQSYGGYNIPPPVISGPTRYDRGQYVSSSSSSGPSMFGGSQSVSSSNSGPSAPSHSMGGGQFVR